MGEIRRLRIGNDYEIVWKLFDKKGNPADMTGRNLSLYYETSGERTSASISVKDNEVSFTFRGRDQKRTGIYRLILIENEGLDGMRTIDTCQAFSLVDRSCEADNQTPDGNVEIEAVEYVSTIELGIKGDSAYDIWIHAGHQGTEEDFLLWLRSAADEAADVANTAAANANRAAEEARKAANFLIEFDGTTGDIYLTTEI
nr:MAG TPA: hypothetical protein [Caudoviricetes sp.]